MVAMEVNQLTEWWREPTHHPRKAGDPQSRQSRNAYPEGFTVPARLWSGKGRTSSGIRERVFYTIICSCRPRTSRERLADNQERFLTGKKTDDGWRGLIWIFFAINLK